jgi:hypothetical protein
VSEINSKSFIGKFQQQLVTTRGRTPVQQHSHVNIESIDNQLNMKNFIIATGFDKYK